MTTATKAASATSREKGDILTPATVEELQALVAKVETAGLQALGGGTAQHIGYPVSRPCLRVSTANLNETIHYSPADLSVTFGAGVTVTDAERQLRDEGQTLGLSLTRPDDATLGGAVATRRHSMMRAAFGSIRDNLLGIHVVDGNGDLIIGGGNVVKNVSGYDLPKLYCGSFGTLGCITQVTLRTRALAKATATLQIALPADRNCEAVLDTLAASDLQPSFVYVVGTHAAARLVESVPSAPGASLLIVGLDGDQSDVDYQLEQLGASEGILDEQAALAARALLRDFPSWPAEFSVSFRLLPSQVGAFVRMVEWTAERYGCRADVVADALNGLMWATFSTADSANWEPLLAGIIDKGTRCGGSFTLEHLPPEVASKGPDIWHPVLVDSNIMRGIKRALDPKNIWNPGRFYAGI